MRIVRALLLSISLLMAATIPAFAAWGDDGDDGTWPVCTVYEEDGWIYEFCW